jgi:hypothetical protein
MGKNLPNGQAGKTGKYLKYAIGEIILVVIGILFALQINNWNNNKITQRESQNFTSRLLNEVRFNIRVTMDEIETEKNQLSSTIGILKMFNTERNKLKPRSLDSLLYICIGKNRIDLKLSTLNEGLNTGKIGLIASDSLRDMLYGLQTEVERVQYNEVINGQDIDANLTPFLYEHLNWRKMDAIFSPYKEQSGTTGFPEHNSLDALNYMLFENLIDNRLFNSNEQLKEYQSLNNALELLEKLIEN